MHVKRSSRISEHCEGGGDIKKASGPNRNGQFLIYKKTFQFTIEYFCGDHWFLEIHPVSNVKTLYIRMSLNIGWML